MFNVSIKLDYNPQKFRWTKLMSGEATYMVARHLMLRIMHRVRSEGRGARGPLKGYSTKPFWMPANRVPGQKAFVVPAFRARAGGTGGTPGKRVKTGNKTIIRGKGRTRRDASGRKWVRFDGGYKEYRESVGLRADRFGWDNKGKGWKDWAAVRRPGAAAVVGFGQLQNFESANFAEAKRPDMWDVNDEEVDRAVAVATEAVADMISDAMAGKVASRIETGQYDWTSGIMTSK